MACKYKVGDRVRIVDEFLRDSHTNSEMKDFLGQIVTIVKAQDDSIYNARYWIEEDGRCWYWLEKTIAGLAYEINFEDFLAGGSSLAIQCETAEEAKTLCEMLHDCGKTWNDGESYHDNYNWDIYKEQTYYTNDGLYGSMSFVSGHRVVKFSVVDFGVPIIPEDAMQVLLRKSGRWIEVKYNASRNRIEAKGGNTVYETEIFAIKNDARSGHAKCSQCGEIIKNTPEDIAKHIAKKSKCAECSHVATELIKDIDTTYELQSDGTYIKNSQISCKLYCGLQFSRIYANTPQIDSVCKYRRCSAETIEPLGGFFDMYPDAFDTIATIDALGERWKHKITSGNTYYYEFDGKTRLYALVNSLGMIKGFEYLYYDNTFEFAYSAKYEKLCWYEGGEYKINPNSRITGRNISIITRLMKEIYKEK